MQIASRLGVPEKGRCIRSGCGVLENTLQHARERWICSEKQLVASACVRDVQSVQQDNTLKIKRSTDVLLTHNLPGSRALFAVDARVSLGPLVDASPADQHPRRPQRDMYARKR